LAEALLDILVRDLIDQLESPVPMRMHVRTPGGHLGGKRFTKAMEHYLKNPPLVLQLLRERKYGVKHRRFHHTRLTCGCKTRLGYRLVWRVVLWSESLTDVCAELELSRETAKRIIESELRIVLKMAEEQQLRG
jgi:hypothetical protein